MLFDTLAQCVRSIRIPRVQDAFDRGDYLVLGILKWCVFQLSLGDDDGQTCVCADTLITIRACTMEVLKKHYIQPWGWGNGL